MPEMKANQQELDYLLKAVDKATAARGERVDPSVGEARVRVGLEDKALWGKFKEHTNEMIVTKTGR